MSETRPTSGFQPKLLSLLPGYDFATFLRDLGAGVIVGVIALPLSIALGIASGVRPEQGLYTAVVAGFLISLLGGSRVQIGGPTGAFVVLVLEIVREHGYDGLAAATMMAGGLLILIGVSGLGRVIRFIPYPVTVGFTFGIALLILTTQIPDFLGYPATDWPSGLPERWAAYARHAGEVNTWAVALGAASVAITYGWVRVNRLIPGSLVAIVATSALVEFGGLPVATIGSALGEVPSSLPSLRLPEIDPSQLRDLFSPAVSIALLAGIESLLSAVVADGMIGGRHRSGAELVAQGVANIASPLFGGIPATGAIARTAANVKNGARTPVAGIIHALTVLAILMFFARWAALIPMAALAGILMVVAYNMSEWHLFLKIFRSTRTDISVLLATFLLTLLLDLAAAIQAGVVLASLLFMLRMSSVTQTERIADYGVAEPVAGGPAASARPGVEVFEINGPFFFGAADRFKDALQEIGRKPRGLILRMRHVPVMDSTGLRALEDVVDRAIRDGTIVILSGVGPQPRELIERGGVGAKIGADNLVGDFEAALTRAEALIAREA